MKHFIFLVFLFVTPLLSQVTDYNYYTEYRGYYNSDNDYYHKFILCVPKNIKNCPLLVQIPGGGWQDTDCEVMRNSDVFYNTIKNNIAVLCINYGCGYKFKFPAQINDCIDAINYICDNYDIDRKKICLYGGSSGGTVVYLLIEKYLKNKNIFQFNLVGSVTTSSPTNFLYLSRKFSKEVFPEDINVVDKVRKIASPYYNISNNINEIPFLIIHGNDDNIVPFSQSYEFVKKLYEYGTSCIFIKQENGNHNLLSDYKETFPSKYDLENKWIVDFILKYLKGNKFDLNDDNVVNQEDYNIFLQFMYKIGGKLENNNLVYADYDYNLICDYNNDNIVNEIDGLVLQNNFTKIVNVLESDKKGIRHF